MPTSLTLSLRGVTGLLQSDPTPQLSPHLMLFSHLSSILIFQGFGIKLLPFPKQNIKLSDLQGPFWPKFCYPPADVEGKILPSDAFMVLLPLCASPGACDTVPVPLPPTPRKVLAWSLPTSPNVQHDEMGPFPSFPWVWVVLSSCYPNPRVRVILGLFSYYYYIRNPSIPPSDPNPCHGFSQANIFRCIQRL